MKSGPKIAPDEEGIVTRLRLRTRTSTSLTSILASTWRRIVLLHGFGKKTEKLPRQELALACSRLARFLEREGG